MCTAAQTGGRGDFIELKNIDIFNSIMWRYIWIGVCVCV